MTDSWIGIGIRNETGEGERAVRQSLSNVEQAANKAKSAAEELGSVFRRGLGAIGAALAIREVIHATIEAEKSTAKLRAQLKATGGVSGQTVEQLESAAAALQKVSIYSDDTVMSAQALMLTFNKIRGDTFPRAIEAATDMASALGQDLGSAAFAVGKALQNPAEGLALLGRQIGGVDDKTKKYITNLVETGHLQQAQAKVLELLESRYKGNAAAMRDTLGGAIAGLKNAFGDLLEGKGGSVTELTASINSMTKTLTDPDTVNAFQQFVSAVLKSIEALVKGARAVVDIMRSIGESAAKLMTMISDPAAVMRMERMAKLNGGKGELLPGHGVRSIAQLVKDKAIDPSLFANMPKVRLPGQKGEQEGAGELSGDALKKAEAARKAYDNLRASLFGVVDGVHAYAEAMKVAKEAGAKPAEIAALSDAFAENLVGGLDDATAATREFETKMGVLQELLGQWEDTGGKMGIDPQRFEELSGRLTETWRTAIAGTEEVGDAIETNITDKLGELQDLLVDLSSTWGKSTATVVNGFGRIVTAQDRIAKSKTEVTKLEKQGKTNTEQYQRATAELTAAQRDQTRSNMSGWATVTEGASQYFNESSKGYKALQAASQVFHAAELALTLVDIGQKAIAAVLNQGEGDPYTAFGRMAAMAAVVAGLGVAIGGIGGGGGGGGSRPGINTGQGTVLGDPMATSKSIGNSLKDLEQIESAGLEVNRLMLVQLRSIDSSLHHVGLALVRGVAAGQGLSVMDTAGDVTTRNKAIDSFALTMRGSGVGAADMFTNMLGEKIGGPLGDTLGAIGNFMGNVGNQISSGIYHTKTSQTGAGIDFDALQKLGEILNGGSVDARMFASFKKTKRILGVNSGSSSWTEYSGLADDTTREFTKVIQNLGQVILDSVDELGGDVNKATKALEQMQLGLDKIDLKGLSAAEIQERLTAVFSALGDKMAETAAAIFDPQFLIQYQQVGEGALQTLVRVAAQTMAITRALETMGVSMEDIAPKLRVEIGQHLIELAGGIEALGGNITNFVDGFYSDAEKQQIAGDRMNRQFAALGLTLPTTASGFRALVASLDLTTDAGQQTFTVLTSMSQEAAQYYDVMTQAMEKARDAMNELRGVLDEVRFNNLLPEDQLNSLLDQFNLTYAGALTSTGTELTDKATELTGQIDPLLEKISQVYATGSQAQELRDFVLSAGDIVASLLEGTAAPSAPQTAEQLSEANEHLAANVRVNQEGFTQVVERLDRVVDRIERLEGTQRLADLA